MENFTSHSYIGEKELGLSFKLKPKMKEMFGWNLYHQ